MRSSSVSLTTETKESSVLSMASPHNLDSIIADLRERNQQNQAIKKHQYTNVAALLSEAAQQGDKDDFQRCIQLILKAKNNNFNIQLDDSTYYLLSTAYYLVNELDNAHNEMKTLQGKEKPAPYDFLFALISARQGNVDTYLVSMQNAIAKCLENSHNLKQCANLLEMEKTRTRRTNKESIADFATQITLLEKKMRAADMTQETKQLCRNLLMQRPLDLMVCSMCSFVYSFDHDGDYDPDAVFMNIAVFISKFDGNSFLNKDELNIPLFNVQLQQLSRTKEFSREHNDRLKKSKVSFNLAVLYQKKLDSEKEGDSLREAIANRPDNIDAVVGYIDFLYRNNKTGKGLIYLTNLIRMIENSGKEKDRLGSLYIKRIDILSALNKLDLCDRDKKKRSEWLAELNEEKSESKQKKSKRNYSYSESILQKTANCDFERIISSNLNKSAPLLHESKNSEVKTDVKQLASNNEAYEEDASKDEYKIAFNKNYLAPLMQKNLGNANAISDDQFREVASKIMEAEDACEYGMNLDCINILSRLIDNTYKIKLNEKAYFTLCLSYYLTNDLNAAEKTIVNLLSMESSIASYDLLSALIFARKGNIELYLKTMRHVIERCSKFPNEKEHCDHVLKLEDRRILKERIFSDTLAKKQSLHQKITALEVTQETEKLCHDLLTKYPADIDICSALSLFHGIADDADSERSREFLDITLFFSNITLDNIVLSKDQLNIFQFNIALLEFSLNMRPQNELDNAQIKSAEATQRALSHREKSTKEEGNCWLEAISFCPNNINAIFQYIDFLRRENQNELAAVLLTCLIITQEKTKIEKITLEELYNQRMDIFTELNKIDLSSRDQSKKVLLRAESKPTHINLSQTKKVANQVLPFSYFRHQNELSDDLLDIFNTALPLPPSLEPKIKTDLNQVASRKEIKSIQKENSQSPKYFSSIKDLNKMLSDEQCNVAALLLESAVNKFSNDEYEACIQLITNVTTDFAGIMLNFHTYISLSISYFMTRQYKQALKAIECARSTKNVSYFLTKLIELFVYMRLSDEKKSRNCLSALFDQVDPSQYENNIKSATCFIQNIINSSSRDKAVESLLDKTDQNEFNSKNKLTYYSLISYAIVEHCLDLAHQTESANGLDDTSYVDFLKLAVFLKEVMKENTSTITRVSGKTEKASVFNYISELKQIAEKGVFPEDKESASIVVKLKDSKNPYNKISLLFDETQLCPLRYQSVFKIPDLIDKLSKTKSNNKIINITIDRLTRIICLARQSKEVNVALLIECYQKRSALFGKLGNVSLKENDLKKVKALTHQCDQSKNKTAPEIKSDNLAAEKMKQDKMKQREAEKKVKQEENKKQADEEAKKQAAEAAKKAESQAKIDQRNLEKESRKARESERKANGAARLLKLKEDEEARKKAARKERKKVRKEQEAKEENERIQVEAIAKWLVDAVTEEEAKKAILETMTDTLINAIIDETVTTAMMEVSAELKTEALKSKPIRILSRPETEIKHVKTEETKIEFQKEKPNYLILKNDPISQFMQLSDKEKQARLKPVFEIELDRMPVKFTKKDINGVSPFDLMSAFIEENIDIYIVGGACVNILRIGKELSELTEFDKSLFNVDFDFVAKTTRENAIRVIEKKFGKQSGLVERVHKKGLFYFSGNQKGIDLYLSDAWIKSKTEPKELADLVTRDITISTLMIKMDLTAKMCRLYDYFGKGYQDALTGIVDMLSAPDKTFGDEETNLFFRTLNYAAKRRFSISSRVIEAILTYIKKLETYQPHVFNYNLDKMLCHGYGERSAKLLLKFGILNTTLSPMISNQPLDQDYLGLYALMQYMDKVIAASKGDEVQVKLLIQSIGRWMGISDETLINTYGDPTTKLAVNLVYAYMISAYVYRSQPNATSWKKEASTVVERNPFLSLAGRYCARFEDYIQERLATLQPVLPISTLNTVCQLPQYVLQQMPQFIQFSEFKQPVNQIPLVSSNSASFYNSTPRQIMQEPQNLQSSSLRRSK